MSSIILFIGAALICAFVAIFTVISSDKDE